MIISARMRVLCKFRHIETKYNFWRENVEPIMSIKIHGKGRSCELTGKGVVNVKGRTKKGWRSCRIGGRSRCGGTATTASEWTAPLGRWRRPTSGGSTGLALFPLLHPSHSRDFRVCVAISNCFAWYLSWASFWSMLQGRRRYFRTKLIPFIIFKCNLFSSRIKSKF